MALAFIWSGNLGGGLPRVEYEKAKQAVTKALELDNNLAEGYAVSGQMKLFYEWDYAAAEKDLLRAIELEPNSDLAHKQYAFYLAVRGRFDEAIAESKTAQEINPDSLQFRANTELFCISPVATTKPFFNLNEPSKSTKHLGITAIFG